MTIVHVTPYFAPAWAFGGVPRAVAGLAAAQARAGHRVHVLTTDAAGRQARLAARHESIDGVEVTRFPNLTVALRGHCNLSTPRGLRFHLRRLCAADPPDVLHVHELRTSENLLVTSALPPRLPVVLSPHGTITYETGRGTAKRLWDRLVGRRVLSRISAVVALSEAEAADAARLWAASRLPLENPPRVIPNGVDADAFSALEPAAAARRRLGLGPGPVVLFLGRLSRRKGLPLLLAAFAGAAAAHPDAQLLVAGPDEDGLTREIRAASARHGVAERVIVSGMLDGEARLAALAAADLFALPASGEGLPVAALEALASGLPVLLSPSCHLPRCEQAGAGLVLPLDAASWTRAIASLLSDAPRRAAMSAAARALVRRDFDWTIIAARVDEAYRSARDRTR